jgi:thiamine biosynthesis protein ThiS
MHITLNGQPHRLETPASVATLVAALGLNPTQAAIERNREIVPRSRWAETLLAEGDAVELVTFVGGG